MSPAEQTFSISREDLAFNYARGFDEVFRFSALRGDAALPNKGVRYTEDLGYDFQNECTPFIEILPLPDEVVKKTGMSRSDMVITVTIEDTALAIRKVIFSIPADEVGKTEKRMIDLKSFKEFSFHRGFEVKCFISRRNTIDEDSHVVWNKSQIIYETYFVAKASLDEALFEIVWTDFPNEEDGKEVLYFVDWKNADVSSEPDVDCFQVRANNKLKDQFKRLENNRHFGGFCIRMIAGSILKELLLQTLKFASLDDDLEPQVDSLHDKFSNLLKNMDIEFDDLARQLQSQNPIEQMTGAGEVTKILQRLNNIGSTLEIIRFGGYR